MCIRDSSAIVDTPFLGSQVTIRRGYWNDNAGTLADEPFVLWRGIANDYVTSYGGALGTENEVTIQVSCKNRLISILEAENGRYTSPASFRRVDQAFRDFAILTAYNGGEYLRQASDNTFYVVNTNIYSDNRLTTSQLLGNGTITRVRVDNSMEFVASLTSFNPVFGAE